MAKKQAFDVTYRYTSNTHHIDWRTIGKAWQEEDGKISIKLGGLPMDKDWDGTLMLFPFGTRKDDAASEE